MPDSAETVTGSNIQVWTDGDGLSHPQSPGWTAPRPGERKNAYGYAVPMGTLATVLLSSARTLVLLVDTVDPEDVVINSELAAWWSICNSLERGDRVALQRECVLRYGDLPEGPWEDA